MADFSIPRSGLAAAQGAMDVAARSIAHLGRSGARGQAVQPQPAEGGGVGGLLSRAPPPATSLETDVVGLLQARNAFLANLAVFKVSDRMIGALLDTRA